jgi:hypothetical protein
MVIVAVARVLSSAMSSRPDAEVGHGQGDHPGHLRDVARARTALGGHGGDHRGRTVDCLANCLWIPSVATDDGRQRQRVDQASGRRVKAVSWWSRRSPSARR